ncbi:MAG: PIN domain-containing protein [Bacteroidales bacterium]|nr:PIN domain-containing protein [Bacteroidales bacterium]
MRVFIDTNIFLDLLWRRERFLADSLKVFDLAVDGRFELLISDLSIANIKYITRKDYSVDEFYRVMSVFRPVFTIVPIGEEAVDQAFAAKARDFEDALQYFSAVQAKADYLLTRNIKDYGFASIEVISPSEFLNRFS